VIQNEIGFIGLGNMGAHMARNLIKKNWKVMVYDVNKEAVDAAVQDGMLYNVYSLNVLTILFFFAPHCSWISIIFYAC